MIRRLSLTALFIAAGAVTAAAQSTGDTVAVGLTDAIRRAVEVSPDIRAQRAKTQFAEARLQQGTSSRLFPELNMTTAHALSPALSNPNNTPTGQLYLDPDVRNDWDDLRPFSRVDVGLVQPLWTGGQLGRTIDAARAGVVLEEAGLEATRLEVAERTGALYYSVVLLEALRRLSGEAGSAVERAKREVIKLLEAGDLEVSEADTFQIVITEQELILRSVRIEEELRTARMALRRQLMLPDDAVVEVEDRFLQPIPFVLDSLSAYMGVGLVERPELAQASAGVAARSALVDVARSDYYPKLFWGVSAHYSGTTGRFRQRNPYVGDAFLSRSVETGLGMRLQLNFRQTRAKVKQAQAQLAEAQHLQTGASQLVQFEVEEAYRRVRFRRAELEAVEKAFLASREWLQTEFINFDIGLGEESTDNLIKAVQAKLELEAGRHQAIFDLNMAILGLYTAAGMLEPMMAH